MDELKLAPYPARPPPAKSDNTLKFRVEMVSASSWVLNLAPHEAFRQQLPPLLWDEASRGMTTYSEACEFQDGGDARNCSTQGGGHGALRNGSVVDIVFENGANVITQHVSVIADCVTLFVTVLRTAADVDAAIPQTQHQGIRPWPRLRRLPMELGGGGPS